MSNESLVTTTTALGVVFALAMAGLAVFVASRTVGKGKLYALLGLGCALVGRLLGVLLARYVTGNDGTAVSFTVQSVLTLAGFTLLAYGVVQAQRDDLWEDVPAAAPTTAGDVTDDARTPVAH